MNTEVALSGLFSIFSSFFGSFAGGGSALLLLSFLLLTTQASALMLITITKVATLALASMAGNLHRKASHLDWKMCAWMAIGGSFGVTLAMFLAQYHLNEELFKKVVAATLFLLAVYQAFFAKKIMHPIRTQAFSRREIIQTMLVFFLLQIVHGITGGMGFFFIVYSAEYLKMSFIQATAYSMISGLPVLLLQCVYLISQTHPPLAWMVVVVLGSLLGSYCGTRFQYLKGDTWVKKASIVMMATLGVIMVF